MTDPRPAYTVSELAAAAGVTDEIMLRRIAGVLKRRLWYRRLLMRFRFWRVGEKT